MSLGVGSLVIGQEPDSSYIKAGESAYQIAVRKGFVGTESDWLQSLQGAGRAYSGAVPPGAPIIGDLWWDTINKRLYVYQTSNWAEVNGNNDEFPVVDLDANAYIAAVEAADTAAGFTGGLEQAVKDAFTMFIVNAKLDGIWSAIKASCIMAGARTLAGALTPLAGVAPTNINFTPADYDRKTGLVGDASTKYLLPNVSNTSNPQNSMHYSVFATSPGTGQMIYIGANDSDFMSRLSGASGAVQARCRNSSVSVNTSAPATSGFIAVNRSDASSFIVRNNKTNTTGTATSSAAVNTQYSIYKRTNTPTSYLSNARLSFYSFGESIDLAKLDSRISTLMSQLNSAIV